MMHIQVFVGAVAKELRAAGPEVGEPGDILRGCQGSCLMQVDCGHGCPPLLSPNIRDSESSFDCSDRYRLYWLLGLGGHELLSAVNVVGCAREGGIGHDVYGERGDIRRPDYASDGKRGAKLVTTLFELIAQQFRR